MYAFPTIAVTSDCTERVVWSYRLLSDASSGVGSTSATSSPEAGLEVVSIGAPETECQYNDTETSLQGGLWQVSNTLGDACQIRLTATPTDATENYQFTSPTSCS